MPPLPFSFSLCIRIPRIWPDSSKYYIKLPWDITYFVSIKLWRPTRSVKATALEMGFGRILALCKREEHHEDNRGKVCLANGEKYVIRHIQSLRVRVGSCLFVSQINVTWNCVGCGIIRWHIVKRRFNILSHSSCWVYL